MSASDIQPMEIAIRPENTDDRDAIREIHRAAFGQENEGALVNAIRSSPGFIPTLSLLAIVEGRTVGHVLFSRIDIETESGDIPVLGLAPLAVDPDAQRRGIGSALVRAGLEESHRLGEHIVIVLGHADYYPRFGFVSAPPLGITSPFAVEASHFMVAALAPGVLDGVAGRVRYPEAFDNV